MASIKGMILKELLKYTIGKSGARLFEHKPNQFTDVEVKKLVKGINDRLYKLEQTGWADDSQLYSNIEKYMKKQIENNAVGIFNMTKDGKPRISSDLSRFGKGAERYKNISYLLNYLTSKTSTSTGTRQAMKKRYEAFMKRPDVKDSKLTFDQYRNLWKTYRDNVSQDAKDRYGSDVVLSAVKEFNFYDLPQERLTQAMDYVNRLNSVEKSAGLKELFEGWKDAKLIVGRL